MMKKYLLKSLIFSLLFTTIFSASSLIAPKISFAQTPPATPDPTGTCILSDAGNTPAGSSQTPGLTKIQCDAKKAASTTVVAEQWAADNSATAVASKLAGQSNGNSNCGITNLTECLIRGVGWVMMTIMQLFSLLTMLAGAILNYVIDYSVVNMSVHYSQITAIKDSWGTIRDLANMCFIFVLLYAAIKTIMGDGGETKKLVVNMIIAALLMNFSFFFTSLIIDASNLLTLTFYKAIVTAPLTNDLLSSGLSNSLMQPLNLSSIWNASSNTLSGTNLITIGVMGSVFTLIAAFVFIAISFMFIIRYVILIFVLIFSPIFVVGSIIPGMKTYAGLWKDALFNQALFAPVYMILTWVVVKIINSCGFILPPAGADGTCPAISSTATLVSTIGGLATSTAGAISANAGTSSIGLVVNFIVIIVFLIATIIIAKKISDKSGSAVSGLNKWAMGAAGGSTLGMAARFGRGTIGRGAQSIADDKDLQARALQGGMGGMAARLQLAAATKTAKGSFDFRGTAAGGQLKAGSAESGGFTADKKKRDDRIKALAKSVGELTPEEKVTNDAAKVSFKAENITKSDDYTNAEQELARAQEEASKPVSTLTDIHDNPVGTSAAEKQARVTAAKTKFEEEKKKHAEKIEAEKKTSTISAGGKRIEKVTKQRENYTEDLKKKWWKPSTDKVMFAFKVKKEVENIPNMVRKASQQKSKEEQGKELLAEAAKEEAAKKTAESSGPETATPSPEDKSKTAPEST